MALNLAGKQQIVAELGALVSDSVSVAAAHYRGLSVEELMALRVKAREMGVVMRVFRNTLARRAVKDTPFSCISEALVGPVMLFFSKEEPSAAAKLLREFVKSYELLQVKGFALDEQLYGPEQLELIASLPTREEALGKLLYVMKAPVSQLVRTINEPVAQCVRVLSQVATKKQEQS